MIRNRLWQLMELRRIGRGVNELDHEIDQLVVLTNQTEMTEDERMELLAVTAAYRQRSQQLRDRMIILSMEVHNC